ncbi:hypothetical protein ElyMa_003510300 [Elysia marginata]|uniref:Uncharacterized protein n=1 Tax=Elysia marginata TaxID=1093978 RepID=A0AAV4EGX1_9GAST|nr:hypothetical protein ElyMa_003510300 [Elysia marginata]
MYTYSTSSAFYVPSRVKLSRPLLLAAQVSGHHSASFLALLVVPHPFHAFSHYSHRLGQRCKQIEGCLGGFPLPAPPRTAQQRGAASLPLPFLEIFQTGLGMSPIFTSGGVSGLTSPSRPCVQLSVQRWLKMPGYVALLLELTILLVVLPSSVRTIVVPVYWNSSSPM